MNLDNVSTSAALSGFIAGVVITVLSALVFVPAGGSAQGLLASGSSGGGGGGGGGTGLFGGGGGGDDTGGTAGGDGGGTSGTGLFGEGGEASGDSTVTSEGGGSTGGTTSGGSSGGTTSGGSSGGTTSGGSSDGTTSGGSSGGTTGGSSGGTTSGGSTSGGSTSGGTTTDTTDGGTTSGGTTSGGDDGGTTGGSSSGGDQLACQPGSNGGSTDTGVTGDSIKLGATIVQRGVGASFLGEARYAMDAVIGKVNGAGGICGRKIDIKYKNDDWDPEKGYQYIRDLVEAEKVFALAVVPSSEGLNQASEAGYFQRSKVPVVGSDGMIRTQYTDEYIFPVATSTVSMMHIMADHAWNSLDARTFGLVFEKTYRFGVEGAYAFNAAYKRLSGNNIKGYEDPFGSPDCQSGTHFCAIAASTGAYGNENRNFNNGCASACDYVAYLMEPATALQWFSSDGDPKPASHWPKGAGTAQPLFTYNFAANCGSQCDDLWIWTGYNPPIEQYQDAPGVRQYVSDLHTVNGQADEFNQFTEGAYLGMVSLAEALAKTGPNLTRQRLMDTLHNITVDVGLSQPLSWKPDDHLANIHAQAFEVSFQQGFKGWLHRQGYVEDRWAGQDME